MADPFDVTDSNAGYQPQPDNSGQSPDMWRNLMQFGLATMAAGATPGATTLGALGKGGLAAMTSARENAAAKAQAAELQGRSQYYGSEAYKNAMLAGPMAQQLSAQTGLQNAQAQEAANNAAMARYNLQMLQNSAPFPGSNLPQDNSQGIPAPSPASTVPSNQQAIKPESSGMTGPALSATPSMGGNPTPQTNAYKRDAAFMPPQDDGAVVNGPEAGNRAGISLPGGGVIPQAGDVTLDPNAKVDPTITRAVDGQSAAQRPTQPTNPLMAQREALYSWALRNPYAAQLRHVNPKDYEPNPGMTWLGDGSGTMVPIKNDPNTDPETIAKIAADKEDATSKIKNYNDFTSEIADKAASSPSANAALDNLKFSASKAQPDAWGDGRMAIRENYQALQHMFGDNVPEDDILNSMVDVKKNEGIVLREVLKSTFSSRITNMDNKITAPTLPGMDTPQTAMPIITGQLQGANDYNIAFNKILSTEYNGPKNKNAAINYVNQRVTPMAFMFDRYPPEVQQKIASDMLAQPGGKAYLKNLRSQILYAHNNGLLSNQIQNQGQ